MLRNKLSLISIILFTLLLFAACATAGRPPRVNLTELGPHFVKLHHKRAYTFSVPPSTSGTVAVLLLMNESTCSNAVVDIAGENFHVIPWVTQAFIYTCDSNHTCEITLSQVKRLPLWVDPYCDTEGVAWAVVFYVHSSGDTMTNVIHEYSLWTPHTAFDVHNVQVH